MSPDRLRLRLRLPCCAVLLALVLTACGDGGGSSGNSYCEQLRELADETSSTTVGTGPSTTQNIDSVQKRVDDAIEKLSSKAPAHLKDDYEVVGRYYNLAFTVSRNPGSDRAELTALQPKFGEASKAISEHNQKVCKVTLTTVRPATPTTATG